ncbi:translocation and assembly module lipoprotein TamL [Fibrella aquatilis]|uniref:BamA/TamA family outer membrane protein n=1 Tax=Fibrella aquatilis TaxID=2817059 RepID=A0A939G592_9BACT|nr:BamA/TamA family outer membrane protein [Fibrella aquatilis]MBO0931438.1 BamA/TamA family outer membrane protein [Fibrella aquatilis]
MQGKQQGVQGSRHCSTGHHSQGNPIRYWLRLLVLAGVAGWLSGCLSARRIPDNKYLLYSQTVKGNKAISTEDLTALIPQRPNKRVLQTPLTVGLWLYQAFSGNYRPDSARRELEALTAKFEQESQAQANDPKALKVLNRRFTRQARRRQRYIEKGNWGMRNLGEPPVYFDQQNAVANAAKMKLYLKNKGFFLAKASFRVDTLVDRRVRVTYFVQEKTPYIVSSVAYAISDKRIDSLVGTSLANSPLKVGKRYDEANINAEKIRIEELLRNQGYYGFSRQYVKPRVARDTTFDQPADTLSQPVDLLIRVLNPDNGQHKVYTIGDVDVRIFRDPAIPLDTVVANGVRYFMEPGMYSTRLLNTKISLRPGTLYRQTDYATTQRQLFLLNQFKFASVNFTDTTQQRLRTLIAATPLDKYDYSLEGGFTLLYQAQGNLPGPFGNLSFRARNLFGGLETFEVALRLGIEAQTGYSTQQTSPVFYSAQEFGVTTSLLFPQILFPTPIRFRFNSLNPRTQFSVGYNASVRPDYSRRNLRGTMTYLWQQSQAKQFTASIFDINYLQSNVISDDFRQFIKTAVEQGSTIDKSFRNAFFSSISFGYTYNTNVVGQNKRANFFRVTTESGGTTLNLLKTTGILSLTEATGLEFYKYLRANVDYRHYLPLAPRTTLAFRANAGLLFGYGPNETAPYEKRFFGGGPNSVRAWLPRRLGLGASYPRSTTTPADYLPVFRGSEGERFDYSFEQPGDVLLEGSAELRGRLFKLFADINGAAFVDVGNVWTLRNLVNAPNTVIPANPLGGPTSAVFRTGSFLEQFAVGTGVGLRIDFSIVVLRLDAAIKVYDPARRYINAEGQTVDERFLLKQFSFNRLTTGPNPVVLNIGIGYPF